MLYEKDKIYNLAIKQIKENNLFFVQDIVAFLPCQKSWFYDNFPAESEQMETFKDLLEQNKIKTKSGIRAKLWKSEKAAELLALYRLIATPDEHRLLNQSYLETRNTHAITPILTNDPLENDKDDNGTSED